MELSQLPYDGSKLNEFLKDNKITEAKEYIKLFFFKVIDPVCIYYWDVNCKIMRQYTYEDVVKAHLTNSLAYEFVSNKKVVTKKISTWFLQEDFDKYYIGMNVLKPHIYKEGQMNYINLFHGFKFTKPRA
mgnify:CR=1 FL=1